MLEPKVIFENDDFVVVDKPAGLMVHAVRIGAARVRRDEKRKAKGKPAEPRPPQEPTLTDWLVARYPAIAAVGDDPALRPGIVHRLDKDTSGVMLVAKTQASFEALKSLFKSREMKKTYATLVFGIPKDAKGIIDRPIGIKNGTLRRSVHAATMAKPAVTEYEVKEKYEAEKERSYALLEVHPQTGRTHQIRVHLASIGHPIVGDRLYGPGRDRRGKRHAEDPAAFPATRLMLHAEALEFSDLKGNRFTFEAPLPEDFLSVIHRAMRSDSGLMVE